MFKLIEIVILWVYYTIPFGFNWFLHFLDIIYQLRYYFQIVWLRITDEGSVPEMRIWYIFLILIPIKNDVYILVKVSLYILFAIIKYTVTYSMALRFYQTPNDTKNLLSVTLLSFIQIVYCQFRVQIQYTR